MSNNFFRQYLDLLDSIEHDTDAEDDYQWVDDDDDVEEADKTDELDFSPDMTMEEVIDTVRTDDVNRIGIGKYREGWHHPFDKRLVIKVATARDDNTIEECAVRNLWEFMVWHKTRADNMPEAEHLMPCYECHPDGLWLTQRKGTRVDRERPIPIKSKTDWIGDRKIENFAMLDGEYRSIDYGSKKALEHLGLPEDYEQCRRIVRSILEQLGHDYQDPEYGKSRPHDDPLADRD